MANVFVEENSLKDIGNAIREKNGEAKQYLPREMGDAVRGLSGEEEWKKYITTMSRSFEKVDFGNYTEINLGSMPNLSDMGYCFQDTSFLKKVTLKDINKNSIYLRNTFNTSKDLEIIDFNWNIVKPTDINYFAFKCSKLTEIRCVFDCSMVKSFYYSFLLCPLLKEIRFVKNTININPSLRQSPLLSSESIQSIIDGLATVTEPQTVSFHPDVKAKLTQEQITQITSKNWNLA